MKINKSILFAITIILSASLFSACGTTSTPPVPTSASTAIVRSPTPFSPTSPSPTALSPSPTSSPLSPPATQTSPTQTIPSPTLEPTAPAESITFAVIGDYGLAGQAEADVAELVKSWQPDLIITSGDNNYPRGAASTIDENIGQYYHQYIHPYQGDYGEGAQVNRFFPTLGNHDWGSNRAQPHLDYFTLPGNERYYDFTWGSVHFFALDSDSREPDGVGVSSTQAAWLKERLAASTAAWKIVYMHHAPISSGTHGSTDWMAWPYQEWGASAVIAGHDHVYERIVRDGFPYFTVGLSGNPSRYVFPFIVEGSQVRYRDDYGAMLVEADETQINFQFITRTGEVIDTYTLMVEESRSSVPTFPDPEGYQWAPVASGLNKPVGMTHADDGSGRLFVIEQAGLIRIVQNGELLPTPFLDIRDLVGSRGNEQGLLGLAFHPRFSENGYLFVNYTDNNGDTVISRFRVSSDGGQVNANTETRLLQVSQPYGNHNGGHVVFGPEGYLYTGLGDGGSGGDPQGNAQNLNTPLGKLLRIDVDGGEPYAIPQDNPFTGGEGSPEVWAVGLRNPWRFSFDRLTGDLYIGDVGQNQWEEINFWSIENPGGANFGWDFREGAHPYEGSPPLGLDLIDPVAEYDHSQGCSVTGGVVYRGSLPEWQGVYLYGDWCSGRVWGLLQDAAGGWQNELLFESGARISAFGEDEDGEVYLVDHGGNLFRLRR
ncbi:MAG: PQQ-dependent sugar dehydrogenase [Anaerolineales bacterium]